MIWTFADEYSHIIVTTAGTRIYGGRDAFEFQLECWLEMKEQMECPVGVYENLYGYVWSFDADIEC